MVDPAWLTLRALWTLQTGVTEIDVDLNPMEGVVGGAVGAFVTTLALGAIMIAIAPGYTERLMATLEDHAVDAFVYGILVLVALVTVVILLVITVLGVLLAIPLILLALLVWGVGAAIAFLPIGDRLVSHDDGWGKGLLVGAALNGVLTLTGIGGLVAFCVGAAGFGVVVRDQLS